MVGDAHHLGPVLKVNGRHDMYNWYNPRDTRVQTQNFAASSASTASEYTPGQLKVSYTAHVSYEVVSPEEGS